MPEHDRSKTAETPDEDPRGQRSTTKTPREVADEYLREEYGIGVDDLQGDECSRIQFERDLAMRQARLSEVGLKVIQMLLKENRPLEALRQVNEEIDRLEEELDALEDEDVA
jgi:hypothetical protein